MRRIDLRKVQAANPHTIRDINRQIVLNYVRERGTDLASDNRARDSALQRSTISEIVEALTGEGLVEEIGEGKSTGGRRPTVAAIAHGRRHCHWRQHHTYHTTIASSDLAGVVVQQETFPTDPVPERTVNRIIEIIRRVLSTTVRLKASASVFPDLVAPQLEM